MKYFVILLLFVGCAKDNYPEDNLQWGFIDGIRVDRIDTFYDHITRTKRAAGLITKRAAGLIRNDTIWEFNYSRRYEIIDTSLIYTDKYGEHKF